MIVTLTANPSIDRTINLTGPLQREAHDLPGDRAAQRRAVPRGGGGDPDRGPPRCAELRRLPGGQAARGAAQPAGTRPGGHDGTGRGQERPACVVEVVGVVVVAEQDPVNRREVSSGDRWSGEFA